MPNRLLLAIALLLGAAVPACAGGTPSAEAPAATPTPSPVAAGAPEASADCAAQTAALGQWMAELAPEQVWPSQYGLELVALDEPGRAARGPLVELGPSATVLDGVVVTQDAGAEHLSRALTLWRELNASVAAKEPPPVVLAVDERVPWRRVVEVTQAAFAGGYRRATWLFARPAQARAKAPSSSLDPQLRAANKLQATERAAALAQMLDDVLEPCPPATELLDGLAEKDPSARWPELANKLPEAVSQCRCAAEVAALQACLWAIYGSAPGNAAVTTRLADPAEADGEAIAAPADQPWSQAHQTLVDGARAHPKAALRLVVF